MKKVTLTRENKKVIKKLIISALVIVIIILGFALLLKRIGITSLTREQIQDYIKSTGALAPLVFIGVSFLQVTFIPIPGVVTIIAGSYLFGAWQSLLYSYIGMNLGGVFAFALGRLIGRPYVNWVAGSEKKASEWMKKLKGREKVFLFFAFLFPYFPDDLLCSVAGALPVTWCEFIIMQLITRFTSIAATLIFMSGEIIPYSGWGLIFIIFVSVLAIVAFILSLIYAEKINELFGKIINKINSFLKKKNAK